MEDDERGRRVVSAQQHVGHPGSLERLAKSSSVIINCAGPFYKTAVAVARAAVEAKVNYIDICDDYEAVPILFSDAAIDKAAKEAGITVLTGMGSSFHALHPLHVRLIGRGIWSTLVETSELIHHQLELLGPGTLLVVVSQSGRSAETVRLLEAKSGSPVVGVTNTAGSPLATAADATVFTRAGEEASVSCKTYVAALLALAWLGSPRILN